MTLTVLDKIFFEVTEIKLSNTLSTNLLAPPYINLTMDLIHLESINPTFSKQNSPDWQLLSPSSDKIQWWYHEGRRPIQNFHSVNAKENHLKSFLKITGKAEYFKKFIDRLYKIMFKSKKDLTTDFLSPSRYRKKDPKRNIGMISNRYLSFHDYISQLCSF